METTTPVRRSERAVYRKLAEDQGGVVLNLETSSYHGVNEVGALIWELTEGDTTFGAIVDGVRERVEEAPPTLEQDVEEFIQALVDRELLEVGDATDADGS